MTTAQRSTPWSPRSSSLSERTLGLNTSLCNWILDFLTVRPQVVRVGSNTTLILDTGAPQGCMLSPLLYYLALVEQVESFKFLGVHITNKLEWSKHTKTVMKRARQNLFPLRRLKRFGMGPQIHKKLYSCTIESIPTGCITAWYGNSSSSDSKALQRVERTAPYITGAKLPAIQDLYTRLYQRKALKIGKDTSHPSHSLFSLLPHGHRYRSTKSRTKRLLNSFYPQAIRLLNR